MIKNSKRRLLWPPWGSCISGECRRRRAHRAVSWEESISGGGNCQCKGPESATCLVLGTTRKVEWLLHRGEEEIGTEGGKWGGQGPQVAVLSSRSHYIRHEDEGGLFTTPKTPIPQTSLFLSSLVLEPIIIAIISVCIYHSSIRSPCLPSPLMSYPLHSPQALCVSPSASFPYSSPVPQILLLSSGISSPSTTTSHLLKLFSAYFSSFPCSLGKAALLWRLRFPEAPPSSDSFLPHPMDHRTWRWGRNSYWSNVPSLCLKPPRLWISCHPITLSTTCHCSCHLSTSGSFLLFFGGCGSLSLNLAHI